jgi:hypothetical protein
MESGEIVSGGGLQGALRGRRGFGVRTVVERIGRWFPENARREMVTTTLLLHVPSRFAWEALRFYEDIPARPSPLLRLVLPIPIRSEGRKLQLGALVRCTYEGGYLVKRITVVDAPRLLRFEVLEQHLGIEHCISLGDGSYEIRDHGSSSEILLTTAYRGHLRPRFLWRPLERILAHAVHRHILRGIGDLQAK